MLLVDLDHAIFVSLKVKISPICSEAARLKKVQSETQACLTSTVPLVAGGVAPKRPPGTIPNRNCIKENALQKFNFEAFVAPPLPVLPKSALPALPKSDAGDELLPLLPLPLLLLVLVPKSPPAQIA